MKRFIVSILCISVFFIGLGTLADNVGARFKSDEKALALVKQARLAIGGDAAIAEIRSMIITGKTTNKCKIDGVERSEQGETEIALQLPDKLMKTVKIGQDDGTGEKPVSRRVDVMVVRTGEGEGTIVGEGEPAGAGHKIVIRKADGATDEIDAEAGKKFTVRKGEGKGHGEGLGVGVEPRDKHFIISDKEVNAHHGAMRQNELLRTTLALLLSAPDGMDVSYTFAGEGDVDGTPVNIVSAEFGRSSFKLFLNRATSLPVMLSYTGHRIPSVVKFRKEMAPTAGSTKDDVVFARKSDGSGEKSQFQVRFADYRNVGGVQLPYKWTTTVGGETQEVFDITAYDINPANIADKFQNQKVFVRKPKPVDN